jgi:hypothetical protein
MTAGLFEETYELIKSLSKTEKRYFKLYTQFQQGDKSYLKLFEIIDAQKTFNEKIISRKFLQKNNPSNFPSLKKYLFDQLVASLKAYGAYKDLDSDHTDLIETYKVLHYKGLHGQSDRLLKKLKKLTLEDDAFTRHFSVLLMEYQNEMFNPDSPSPENVVRILKERRDTLAIMDNYLAVGETFTLVRLHLRKKLYCRNKKDKEELTKIIGPLLHTTEAGMLSRTALGMRNVTLCDYYLAIGQPKKAFETSKVYLELRKNAGGNDKLDLQTLNEYLQHIVISIRSGVYENFESDMMEYKAMIDTIRNRKKYFMAYEKWYNLVLIYYNRTGQFEQGASFREKEQKKNPGLEKNFSMKSKITLWYFTAYNQFSLREFKTALKWIQKIMNEANDMVEEFSFAKLLLMFIHYDLGNYELLEYQVRSAQRMMVRADRMYKCEKLLFDFFKPVSGADSTSRRKQQLDALQKKVIIIFKDPFERGFSYYFDIRSWIEGKLTNSDFAEVVRKSNAAKAKKKTRTDV